MTSPVFVLSMMFIGGAVSGLAVGLSIGRPIHQVRMSMLKQQRDAALAAADQWKEASDAFERSFWKLADTNRKNEETIRSLIRICSPDSANAVSLQTQKTAEESASTEGECLTQVKIHDVSGSAANVEDICDRSEHDLSN